MQHVVLIPETEWRQLTARLEKLEAAEQARATPPPVADEPLPTAEAAARIGLSVSALLRARRAGKLQGVRLNEKDWGFRPSVLDRYPRRYHRQVA